MRRSSSEARLNQLLTRLLPEARAQVRPIAGLTGESWRISAPGVEWLAREASAMKRQLGVSRCREGKMLRTVGGKLCVPQVIYEDKRWLIASWLQGVALDHAQFTRLAESGRLAQLLGTLHRQPLCGYRLCLPAVFALYWQSIDRRRLSPRWLALQRRFMRCAPPQALRIAPVHLDLHAGNIVQTQSGVALIDWEYAADADTALELALLMRGNVWSMPQLQHFLAEYAAQQGYSSRQLTQQVVRWLPWADYLMLLWFEVRWQQSGDAAFLQWGEPVRDRLMLG